MNPDLEVYGEHRLSVVDASVMPLIPTSHTCSTVYAVAEKVRSSMHSTIMRISLPTVNLIKVL